MYIPELKYYKPETINDVYKLLNSQVRSALLAGGTDLLLELKEGKRRFDNIISLNGLEQLKNIKEDENRIIIGSCATHSRIAESEIIRNNLPALAQAVLTIGTHQIRNTATIGGNLCTCASCADSAPILMIYDALIEIGSENGIRTVKLSDFFIGHHVNALKQGELLLNIIVPKPLKNFSAYFEKFGLRESASISVASVALSVTIKNDIILDSNVIIGACAPTPIKSEKAISAIKNKNINDLKNNLELMKQIGDAAASEVLPIDDIRATADYRRNIVSVITQRLLLKTISN